MSQEHCHGGKSSERIIDKWAIFSALPIRGGWHILDAGCGDGYMALEFSRLAGDVGRVYAFDVYAPGVDSLKSRAQAGNLDIRVCDICGDLDIPDGSLDMVYLSTVYHGFSALQRTAFVGQVRKKLKSEGILAIVEIVKASTPFGPPHEIRFSPDELIDDIGMQPIKTVPIGEYFYLQLFSSVISCG